jgi:LuxR family transcriptional regulator, maltose regulon positive regulatory protein
MVDLSGESGAAGPLLETKLYIPWGRPALVPRPRLTARLEQGAKGKLTLISAPAGFGKTTLLADWAGGMAADRQPAAWVSLDQGDNNPALFWSYAPTGISLDSTHRVS